MDDKQKAADAALLAGVAQLVEAAALQVVQWGFKSPPQHSNYITDLGEDCLWFRE